MRDFRPFLQVVHVAGLRVAHPDVAGFCRARAGASGERLAPHDPLAAEELGALLESIAIVDPIWRRLSTWIVDSGELTLFGDDASMALGRAYLRDFCARSLARGRLEVPGPRDLWGQCADRAELSARLAYVRERWFPIAMPSVPLRERSPGGRLEVQLYGIESGVLGGAPDGGLSASQRSRLAAAVEQYQPEEGVRALRIALAHAPVAHALGAPEGGEPLVHLALCALEQGPLPPLGLFSDAASGSLPLQLGVGPLLAPDWNAARGPYSQQCALLRFYYSPSRPRAVLVERLLAARVWGVGPFRFVPIVPPDEVAEELLLDL